MYYFIHSICLYPYISLQSWFSNSIFKEVCYTDFMKKILIWISYIFSALVVVSSLWFILIVFFKPETLNDILAWMMNLVEILWWKNYLLAWWVGILESIPFINVAIPGQTFMIIIAWFVAQFNYIGILMVVVLSSTIWDAIAYYLGKKQWESILSFYGPSFGLTQDRVIRIKSAMKDHAHRAIFASKWNSYTRGVLPFIAWSAHTNFREFMVYNMLGSLAYGIVLVSLAKVFVWHYQVVAPYVRWVWLWVLIIAVVWYLVRYVRNAGKTR